MENPTIEVYDYKLRIYTRSIKFKCKYIKCINKNVYNKRDET